MSSTPLVEKIAYGRYLPGIKLPNNINAIPDIETAAKDADILVFNFPHQERSPDVHLLHLVRLNNLWATQRTYQPKG